MYETLKEFNNIVVSGPQRSGTRIAAKILASETNKEYIDEKFINFHDFRLLNYYLHQSLCVIQCPGLCHKLHEITDNNTLVIFIVRPTEEILASESRSWTDNSRFIELAKYGYTSGIISDIKYSYWKKVQKSILKDLGREIRYHALEEHPLFIKDRKNFRWDQTE